MSLRSQIVQSSGTEHGAGDGRSLGQVSRASEGEHADLSTDHDSRQVDGLPILTSRDVNIEDDASQLHRDHGYASATSKESSARQYLISEVTQSTSLNDQPLASSQIGASYWTSFEKQTVLRNAQKYGSTNLVALSRSIPTKSEPEIHFYLNLLQDGATEALTQPHTPGFSFENVSAAYEISPELEANLNAAADVLRQKVEFRDAHHERANYGTDWLVDERFAASIVAGTDTVIEDDSNISEDDRAAAIKEDDVHDEITALGLLNPEILLDLSSTIFMNSTLGSEQNWRELLPSDGSIEGPAIFRTAFEDLYSLVVYQTRRLVQGTLYQSQSRLRASDDSRANWQPKPEVREIDVRAAISILGMRPTWPSYWAKLPQRLGIEVYSDVQRYKDGRPGTKTGVKLTAREIEYELGAADIDPTLTSADDLSDVVLSDFGSDDLTEVSESDCLSEDGSDHYAALADDDEKGEGLGNDAKRDPAPRRKRRRSLSPSAFARAEAQLLEHLDRDASKEEVQQLWNIVGKTPDEAEQYDNSMLRPLVGGKEVESADHWRRQVKYWSHWEFSVDAVPQSAFVSMHECGVAGHEKRRRLHQRTASEDLDHTTADTTQARDRDDVSELGPESVDKFDGED
ncbi:hypothetical protein LTR78_008499 [Recurvomyces mirabilis]|uniref:Uncharacterized protein n=1 Tax=Recurvomyces mirabilis TaxID=574656 RepID=A0AAE0TQT0_9PEZI|nr:hypothetical protein LTR78_008499 [Recurvomyces mirabilis]KAK5156251.1 hypothetical protein LTS14_005138 [Recurvomyces mirabilis]